MGFQTLDSVAVAYAPMAYRYSADDAIIERACEGYHVVSGCAISASGTAGKLDMAAGYVTVGNTELVVTAQTAITPGAGASKDTITELADATNPKWVLVELDTAQVVQYNEGTATASPVPPTPTASRVILCALYIPVAATAVDALLSTANGKAKIVDKRNIVAGPLPTGWTYDTNTWVYVSGSSFKISGLDATAYLTPGTRVSWDDATNTPGYGVIATSVFSTDTTVTLITTDDYTIANHAIVRPRYSTQANPVGFPKAFTWTPTLSGWSPNPSGPNYYRWWTNGRTITILIRQVANGTSNSTTHTATIPVTAATIGTNHVWLCAGSMVDNNTTQVGAGFVATAGTTVDLRGTAALTNTGTGNSRVNGLELTYEF